MLKVSLNFHVIHVSIGGVGLGTIQWAFEFKNDLEFRLPPKVEVSHFLFVKLLRHTCLPIQNKAKEDAERRINLWKIGLNPNCFSYLLRSSLLMCLNAPTIPSRPCMVRNSLSIVYSTLANGSEAFESPERMTWS